MFLFGMNMMSSGLQKAAGDISEETSNKIKAMYKIIGELESLGDSGEAISRILQRRNAHKKSFDAETVANLQALADRVDAAYACMIANLTAAHEGRLGNNNNNSNIINAYNAEDEINAMRNRLRDSEIDAIDAGIKNYQSSVYYLDIVSEFERMGDFLINISQDLERGFGR